MRTLLPLLGLPLGLALWGASLWWRPPYSLSLRLEPRPPAPAAVARRAPPVWRVEVTETFPHLEGLAVGDRVQFDRYGILPPTRGSVQCVPVGPDSVQFTPIGGRLTHAGHVDITRVPGDTPGCEPAPRPQPLLSLHR
jgi:hypothetical protein